MEEGDGWGKPPAAAKGFQGNENSHIIRELRDENVKRESENNFLKRKEGRELFFFKKKNILNTIR